MSTALLAGQRRHYSRFHEAVPRQFGNFARGKSYLVTLQPSAAHRYACMLLLDFNQNWKVSTNLAKLPCTIFRVNPFGCTEIFTCVRTDWKKNCNKCLVGLRTHLIIPLQLYRFLWNSFYRHTVSNCQCITQFWKSATAEGPVYLQSKGRNIGVTVA